MVFSSYLFIFFLSSAGAAGVLCCAQEAPPPHTDNLQLHLLRVGEPVVLPADVVQHERGLHEWSPDAGVSSIEKTVLKIEDSGKLTYKIKIADILDDINNSESIVSFIPHSCICNTTCKITVNGTQKAMHAPNYAKNSSFFYLAFELPAGTEEITILIEGKPGTLLAIKDIQLWQ